jgi:ATP-dependent DNA helicase RecG
VPIPISLVTAESAEAILNRQESHFCDMKAREIAPKKLTRTLSAFANADGGELYIGIAENADQTFRWDGFQRIEDANSIIQVIDQFFTSGLRPAATSCTAPRLQDSFF